jgi:hypothetical protein
MTSKPSNSANSLMQTDAPMGDPGAPGGVFRLEAMAPGVENAEALAQPKKRKLSTQTLILAMLLVAGGGLVYAMRVLGIGPLTTLGATKMPDYDLTSGKSKTAEHKRVLEQLNAANVTTQVPVEQVQKNPFVMSELLGPEPTAADPNAKAGAERAKRDADARKRRFETALNGLKLNGVLGGSNPVARISGDAVRVGDVVGEIFKVKAIHDRRVELEFDGQIFTLSMDDDKDNHNGKRK